MGAQTQTFGDCLVDRLYAAKAKAGLDKTYRLDRYELVRIVNDELAKIQAAECPPVPQIPRRAKNKAGTNIPPTPEEVTAYSAEIGYPLNGQKWCDAYEAKGWMISGKNKMKNWQAAVRNWRDNRWGVGTIALSTRTTTTSAKDYSKI
jgi:hypothetical protein